MKLEITKELLEKLFNYLAQKPYHESAPLIQELAQCKPIEERQKEDKE